MLTAVYIFILLVSAVKAQEERVAPGVPPLKYEQATEEQVPHNEERVAPGVPPVKYEQATEQSPPHEEPVAPGVPPAKYEQTTEPVPHHEDHDHHHDHKSDMFDTSSIDKERDHIQRHMSVPIDTTKMSSNELQFHYFKMYDTDDNNMLDGCELMKSVLHWHDDQTKNNTGETENQNIPQAFTDETLAELIDPLLIRGDLNKDGFIDYGEYQVAQIKKEPDQPTQPE